MNTRKIVSVLYFLMVSYLVFGIRIYPQYLHIHHGYNLNIWKRYSDVNTLRKGERILKDIDFWGNVLLFVPFPFCVAALLATRNVTKLICAGIICSVGIELTQFVLDIGFADINDVLTNTCGTLLGAWLLVLWRKRGKQYAGEGNA